MTVHSSQLIQMRKKITNIQALSLDGRPAWHHMHIPDDMRLPKLPDLASFFYANFQMCSVGNSLYHWEQYIVIIFVNLVE